jgi:hypothetical protein
MILEWVFHDMYKKFTVYNLLTGWLPVNFILFLLVNLIPYILFSDSLFLGDFRNMEISKKLIWIVNILNPFFGVGFLVMLAGQFPFSLFNTYLSLVTYFLSLSMFALFLIPVGYKIINAITNKGIKKIIINNRIYNIK